MEGGTSRCDSCRYFWHCKNTCDTCLEPCADKCPADCGAFDPDGEEAPIPRNPGDREYDAEFRDPLDEPELDDEDNDTER